ncbi:hypothetical protein V8C35DRAFT_311149 [Trichoderma chlorosporum]
MPLTSPYQASQRRQPTKLGSSPAGDKRLQPSSLPCQACPSPSNPVAGIRRRVRYRQPRATRRTNRHRPHFTDSKAKHGTAKPLPSLAELAGLGNGHRRHCAVL